MKFLFGNRPAVARFLHTTVRHRIGQPLQSLLLPLGNLIGMHFVDRCDLVDGLLALNRLDGNLSLEASAKIPSLCHNSAAFQKSLLIELYTT